MSVVDEDTELIFLLESHYLVEDTESACHAEHTFCDEKYTATGLLHNFSSALQHLLAADDIVVFEVERLSHVETFTVDKASMSLSVEHDDIVTCAKRVDC